MVEYLVEVGVVVLKVQEEEAVDLVAFALEGLEVVKAALLLLLKKEEMEELPLEQLVQNHCYVHCPSFLSLLFLFFLSLLSPFFLFLHVLGVLFLRVLYSLVQFSLFQALHLFLHRFHDPKFVRI